VVDDDQNFRNVLCSALNEQGLETQEAEDGLVAIYALENSSFDLIISDITMPRSSGMDLLKWVQGQNPVVPVILITGFSELYETSEALKLGAAGFMPKPFKRDELLSLIHTVISGKAAAAPEENLDETFCKIGIDDFVTGSMINLDIYIRLTAKKYVKIAHTGQDISSAHIANYKAKGINYLYVSKESFKKYLGFGAMLAKVVSRSAQISAERKINFLRHTSEILVQHFFNEDIDGEILAHAKNVVETTISLLSDSPDAFKLLESLNQQSDFTYAHSVGVSFHAVMLAKRLKWHSPLTHAKLAVAGLFHDIGKKELPKELLAKARHELTASELTQLESHPTRGMELLTQIRDIPSDVIQIALQHHENPVGTGYPYHLRGAKIHPLARVVSVADEFCYLTLPSASGKGLPAKEALQMLVRFHTEKLDADVLRALFMVYGAQTPSAPAKVTVGKQAKKVA
jgi:putative nucleotidyltransferase with HDIG domain